MHNVGTVPIAKTQNVETVPAFKIHNVGTLMFHYIFSQFEFGFYVKKNYAKRHIWRLYVN